MSPLPSLVPQAELDAHPELAPAWSLVSTAMLLYSPTPANSGCQLPGIGYHATTILVVSPRLLLMLSTCMLLSDSGIHFWSFNRCNLTPGGRKTSKCCLFHARLVCPPTTRLCRHAPHRSAQCHCHGHKGEHPSSPYSV